MAGGQFKAFASSITLDNFTAKKVQINIGDASVEDLETSYMGQASAARTYVPSDLYDPGTISGSAFFDPDTYPPVGDEDASISISWPDGSTWSFAGYMKSFSVTGERDSLLMMDFSIKVSGEIAVS